MFVGAVLVVGLVMLLLAIALRPERASRSAPEASILAGVRIWLVGGGLVFPSVVLLALLLYGLVVGERLVVRPDTLVSEWGAPLPLRVTAEARRWQWTFGYPSLGTGAQSVGRLHIPAGRPVVVQVSSRDVIHSFWVPRLAGKVDAIPGRTTVLRLEAREPGIYAGVCAEYCGAGHARHGFEVEAHAPDDWARAVAQAAPRASAAP
jgi:heme/copper-type cytochrome/quinol oxidase subunit 2